MRQILLVWILSFGPCFAGSGTGSAGNSNCDSLPADARIVYSLNHIQSPALTAAAGLASDALYVVSIAAPAGFFAHGMIGKDRTTLTSSIMLSGGEALTYGLVYILKQSIGRERPFQQYPDCIIMREDEKLGSMPSGHAAGTACITTVLSLRYPQWYVVAPLVAYTLFTDFSRMHLGVHYPTDLIAGTLLGAGAGYLAYRIFLPFEEKLFPSQKVSAAPVAAPLISFSLPL